MTDDQIKEYYSGLLILQYKGKSKAKATVEANIHSMISGQIFNQILGAFDLESSLGSQLDIIGKYVGVNRDGNSFVGPVTLDDEDYRTLIKLKIIINTFNSSLSDTQDLLDLFFKDRIFVFDYTDMSISYYLDGSLGSQELIEVFINKNLLPRPMGVGLGSTVYSPSLIFFGFRTYYSDLVNSYPMNDYDSYNDTWTWLSYANAINSPVKLESPLLLENGSDILLTEDGREILI